MQRPLAHDVLKIAQRRMIMRHPFGSSNRATVEGGAATVRLVVGSRNQA